MWRAKGLAGTTRRVLDATPFDLRSTGSKCVGRRGEKYLAGPAAATLDTLTIAVPFTVLDIGPG
jgi:hypothetical protein